METRTRDMLFGTGRSLEGLRSTFAPAGTEPAQRGDVLATYQGPGRERVLGFLERRGMITAEQRAANGPAASAVDELVDSAGTTRGLVGASADASGAAGTTSTQYANPVYHGLYAQSLMQHNGFVAPTAAPAGLDAAEVRALAETADEVAPAAAPIVETAAAAAPEGAIAGAADDAAARVYDLEQRLVGAMQRLAELPGEQQLPVLTRAVDATAQHGGDSYTVLSNSLLQRPMEDVIPAIERSLDDAAKLAAPVADDAAKVAAPVADDVAKAAAPVVDDVAKVAPAAADLVAEVVAKAVPQVVEAATPKVVASAGSRLLLGGSDDALRGVMSFSAGVDDTLRLLAKF